MSKNALEQIRDQDLHLKESVDSLNEVNAIHIIISLRITMMSQKVDLFGQSVKDSVVQMGELKEDIQTQSNFFKQQLGSLTDELTLLKMAICTSDGVANIV